MRIMVVEKLYKRQHMFVSKVDQILGCIKRSLASRLRQVSLYCAPKSLGLECCAQVWHSQLLSSEHRLRELGPFSQKRRLQGRYTAASQYINGAYMTKRNLLERIVVTGEVATVLD